MIPTRSVAAALLNCGTEKYPIVPVMIDWKTDNVGVDKSHKSMVRSMLAHDNYVGYMDATDDFSFFRKEVCHPYGYGNDADSDMDYLSTYFDSMGFYREQLEIDVDVEYSVKDINILTDTQPIFSIRLEDFPMHRFRTYLFHVLGNQYKNKSGFNSTVLSRNFEGAIYTDEDSGVKFQTSELLTVSPEEINEATLHAIKDFPYCMYKLIMLSIPLKISLLSMCFEYAYKELHGKDSELDWKPAELISRGRIYNINSATGEIISPVYQPTDKTFRYARDWVVEQLAIYNSPFSRYFKRMLECIKILKVTPKDLDAKDYTLSYCYKILDDNMLDDMAYYDRINMFSRNLITEGIIRKTPSLDDYNNIEVIIDVIKRSNLSQEQKFSIFDVKSGNYALTDSIVKSAINNPNKSFDKLFFKYNGGEINKTKPACIYTVGESEDPLRVMYGNDYYYLTLSGKLIIYEPKNKSVHIRSLFSGELELEIKDEEGIIEEFD